MKPRTAVTNKYFEDLDSDDELPNNYVETPEIPAYLNDDRFETLNFWWLDNAEEESETAEHSKTPATGINTNAVSKNPNLLRKGFLNEQDACCLRILKPYLSNEMLLWLIDYMCMKDLNSPYQKFITSCLTLDDTNDSYSVEKVFSKHKVYDCKFGNNYLLRR